MTTTEKTSDVLKPINVLVHAVAAVEARDSSELRKSDHPQDPPALSLSQSEESQGDEMDYNEEKSAASNENNEGEDIACDEDNEDDSSNENMKTQKKKTQRKKKNQRKKWEGK